MTVRLTDADRATLANVLRELGEIDVVIQEKLIPVSEYQTDRHVLRVLRMRVLYIEGRIRGLLAEPIPAREGE